MLRDVFTLLVVWLSASGVCYVSVFTDALGRVAEVCMTVFDASSFKSMFCVSPQRKRCSDWGAKLTVGKALAPRQHH